MLTDWQGMSRLLKEWAALLIHEAVHQVTQIEEGSLYGGSASIDEIEKNCVPKQN